MSRLVCLVLLTLSAPAFAQLSPETPRFRHDMMVTLGGAYFSGIGADTGVQVDDHVRVRLGIGMFNVNPWQDKTDVAARATLLGVVGSQSLEFQGGIGGTATYYTEHLKTSWGEYAGTARRSGLVPHAYLGVRSVLAIGADEEGRSASAPHLSARLGGVLTVGEPWGRAARFRPEIGAGFAF